MRIKPTAFTGLSDCRIWTLTVAIAVILGGSAPASWSTPSDPAGTARPKTSAPWHDNQIIQPEQLVESLSATNRNRPVVLCVGFPILYHGAHIVGARFAGPAVRPEGIQKLKRAVQGLPNDKQIVVYCGCCPWNRCPNIRPAFDALQELGFTNIKVLSIPTDFHTDWVAKGYPVEKGAEKQ